VTDDLRAFRSDLAAASPAARARARRRLEGRIASEVARGRAIPCSRPLAGTRALTLAGALAASFVLGAATATVWDTGDGGRDVRVEAPGGVASAAPWRARGGPPDGLLAALPSLEGKDAGTRPTFDRGGWSECGTSECYLSS
jgi:hypothetical protein